MKQVPDFGVSDDALPTRAYVDTVDYFGFTQRPYTSVDLTAVCLQPICMWLGQRRGP